LYVVTWLSGGGWNGGFLGVGFLGVCCKKKFNKMKKSGNVDFIVKRKIQKKSGNVDFAYFDSKILIQIDYFTPISPPLTKLANRH